MILLTQNKNLIIFDKAEIYKTFGDEKNVKIEMVTQNDNYISLGEYDTAERADEIISDIYSKLVDKKENYKMPKEWYKWK